MLPFAVQFESGMPVHEQVLYAVKKAIVMGQLIPGDRFPSVRTLSQELRINPNTAHRVVSLLIEEGLLQVQTGIGTVVVQSKPATKEQRRQLLQQEVERLVVEASTMSLSPDDVLEAIKNCWSRLVKDRA